MRNPEGGENNPTIVERILMSYNTSTREIILNRGREFMRARQEYVAGRHCLEGMIMACIEDGATTRNAIVRTVPRYVGHSYAHVGWCLDQVTGPDPKQHLCFQNDDKRYQLHPQPKRRTRAKQGVSAA